MKNTLLILFNLLFFNNLLTAQVAKSDDSNGVFWKPIVEMDDKLYPSYVLANVNRNYLKDNDTPQDKKTYFGDSEGQFGIEITYLKLGPANVKLVIECPKIMETSSFSVYLNGKSSKYQIFPEIAYKWDVLTNIAQPFPVNVNYYVYVNDVLKEKQTKIVTVRSINDCPFIFIHRQKVIHDMNFMYAAYVNENHPVITNQLMPEIMRTGIVNSITGYQTNDRMEVLRQVFAVWNVLRQRGVKYSSLVSSNNEPAQKYPLVVHQFVRRPSESLASQQANCVDGTVLFASILYRMGIHPLIVTTPNHCWLGFYTNAQHTDTMFLETTMMGSSFSADQLETAKGLDVYSLILDRLYPDSYKTFLLAVKVGFSNYSKDKNKFLVDSKVKFLPENADIEPLQYQIFEIERYRREGLLPIISN